MRGSFNTISCLCLPPCSHAISPQSAGVLRRTQRPGLSWAAPFGQGGEHPPTILLTSPTWLLPAVAVLAALV